MVFALAFWSLICTISNQACEYSGWVRGMSRRPAAVMTALLTFGSSSRDPIKAIEEIEDANRSCKQVITAQLLTFLLPGWEEHNCVASALIVIHPARSCVLIAFFQAAFNNCRFVPFAVTSDAKIGVFSHAGDSHLLRFGRCTWTGCVWHRGT